MYRVRTTVTGVAGAPYYLTGYFDSTAGTPANARDAWHNFVTQNGVPANVPASTTWTTDGQIFGVDPANGNITNVFSVTPSSTTGTSIAARLAPSSQYLFRNRTGFYSGGREVRGHFNLPFPLVGDANADGTVKSTVVTSLNTRASALLALSNANYVVWSKKAGLWAEVTAMTAWEQYSVLRSRRD